MKKLYVLTLAACAASSFAFAQETVKTEKTEVTQSANGTTQKTTTKISTNDYVNHMRTVYTSAGIPQTKTERLIELDRQLFEAYRAGDVDAVRRIRLEIRTVLGEDVTRVYTYIEGHPLPATYPGFIVNTYAPESAFTRDITLTGTGVSGSSTGINVNRTGTSAGTVSGSVGTNATGASGTGASVSGSAGTSTQGTSSQGTVSGSGSTGTGSTGTGSTGSAGTGSTGSAGTSGASGTGSTGSTGGTTGGTSSGSTGGSSGSSQ